MSTATTQREHPAKPFLLEPLGSVKVSVTAAPAESAPVLGFGCFTDKRPPKPLGLGAERLKAAGFSAEPGSALTLAREDGPLLIAVGLGRSAEIDAARIRDAAAAFADAASAQERLALSLEGIDGVSPELAAHAAVEGALLARYEYAGFGRQRKRKALEEITLIARPDQE
ncbi:MAG TPA: M17 family peptidase N-terminal domain-containing protein, partial [Gammaproteobacteria bacterium]